jgi:hypothetical protein
MPKSHKRWTSYELMLKRVKKHAYCEAVFWGVDHHNGWFLTTKWTRDRRDPETIAHHRAIRAENRAYWVAIHEMVLALATVFHVRLGGDSLWQDLPEPIMCLIVREAYISKS